MTSSSGRRRLGRERSRGEKGLSKPKTSLTVAALGIVFGGIGTSLLHSFREAATAAGTTHPEAQIFGVLSLIVWTITLSVSFKYVGLVLRVNNDGDGVITPAIPVLSAIEGLEVAAPSIDHFVVPLTVLVLLALLSISAVLGVQSSDSLAEAYGMAVATAMITTTVLFVAALIFLNRMSKPVAWAIGLGLLTIDLIYFIPNLAKLATGGWLPLSLASVAMIVMISWRIGVRRSLKAHGRTVELLGSYALALENREVTVPRRAVFLTRGGDVIPEPLANMDRLPGSVFTGLVMVSVRVATRPRVPPEERILHHWVGDRVLGLALHVGCMQTNSLLSLIGPVLHEQGRNPEEMIHVVGHEQPLPPRRWLRDPCSASSAS